MNLEVRTRLQPVPDTTIPKTHRDLLDAPIPVALTTIGPSGYPQVTAVWAISDGETVVISLTTARQKLKNLQARPQANVFVIDPANSYRTLEVRGDVTVEPDPDLTALAEVLAGYNTDLASFSGPKGDRMKVTLHPTRVVAQG